jgi:hypothetical protein
MFLNHPNLTHCLLALIDKKNYANFRKFFDSVHVPWGELSVGRVVHEAKCPWEERSLGRNVRGKKCPWGELSVEWDVRGAKCPRGEMSVGRNVRGAKFPWGEMSVGRNVRGASCRGWVVMGRVVLGRVVLGHILRSYRIPAKNSPSGRFNNFLTCTFYQYLFNYCILLVSHVNSSVGPFHILHLVVLCVSKTRVRWIVKIQAELTLFVPILVFDGLPLSPSLAQSYT